MFQTLKSYTQYEPNQQEATPGQIQNNAGGFSFPVTNWQQLERFLILGTTGGTYYVSEHSLTEESLVSVEACISEDPGRVLQILKDISLKGRAPKNDPALFVLALLWSKKNLSPEVRSQALIALPEIARTFTHLSHFMTFYKSMRGMSRSSRRALSAWWGTKSIDSLIYQAIKYKSRDGFSQGDVARLAHAGVGISKVHSDIFSYLGYLPKGGQPRPFDGRLSNELLKLEAVKQLEAMTDSKEAPAIIRQYKLPMEIVPTTIRDKEVYRAVAETAKLGWLLRNVGNLSKVGLLTPEENIFSHTLIQRLTDETEISKARLHPLSIFTALNTYKEGKGFKGKGTWDVYAPLLDALTEAFYKSFKFVEPTNKRILLGIDVSGSMMGTQVNGMPNLTCHEAAGILAMTTVQTEQNYRTVAFDTVPHALNISPKQRLDDVVKALQIGGGGTDCAIPFNYAYNHDYEIDTFVSFTDSETWAGQQHVHEALSAYRKKTGIPAKAINVAMTANRFSGLKGSDPLSLEVVGFDTTVPQIIHLFSGS